MPQEGASVEVVNFFGAEMSFEINESAASRLKLLAEDCELERVVFAFTRSAPISSAEVEEIQRAYDLNDLKLLEKSAARAMSAMRGGDKSRIEIYAYDSETFDAADVLAIQEFRFQVPLAFRDRLMHCVLIFREGFSFEKTSGDALLLDFMFGGA
jgi:hypothetical protein